MKKESSKDKSSNVSRRKFLATSAAATAGFTILPSTVIAGMGHKAPSDKLNIAGIGIGGKGGSDIKEVSSENIVALCDVDWKYSQHVFEYFPVAKKYKDWRVMYDELGKSIDALIIATPDHTHAVTAAHAITMGKHVFLQKPLTHSVYESRLLTRLAEKYRVATCMGNQGTSTEDASTSIEWLESGVVGEVHKVEAFTDRPIWPQGLNRPDPGMWVPDWLDWDLFIGPARMRPYHEAYTPWNWRGWWDFGVGALGDMGCHILHPVYFGLGLGHPSKIQATSSLLLNECAPQSEMVKMTFPARRADNMQNKKQAEVEVIWYDGGFRPMVPDGWPAGKNMNTRGGGVLFHGEKDIMVTGNQGCQPWLMSGRVPDVKPYRRRVNTSHEMDWVRACKESPENRTPTHSDFAEAGPYNEMVVLGTVAVRLQSLFKELEWDGEQMEFTNLSDNEEIKTVIRDNFAIIDGHPTFKKDWTDPVNAKAFGREMIRHTYREPWKLPDMPA